jgi:hypothetical protein
MGPYNNVFCILELRELLYSKLVRCQLSHPHLLSLAAHLPYLATHLPSLATHLSTIMLKTLSILASNSRR